MPQLKQAPAEDPAKEFGVRGSSQALPGRFRQSRELGTLDEEPVGASFGKIPGVKERRHAGLRRYDRGDRIWVRGREDKVTCVLQQVIDGHKAF